jgi:uncharacterized membrane protein
LRSGPFSFPGPFWEQTFVTERHPTEQGADSALKKRPRMWLAIAIILLIGWLIGFIAFHVTVFAIHILLILFVIFLIIHFVRKVRA